MRTHATSPGYTGSRSILASLLLLAAIGCDGKGGTPATESSDPAAYAVMLPRDARDSALVAAARVARAAVDSQVHASPGSMILVAGLANGSMALVSPPGGWPESTAVSYDVFPDQRGQVRLAFQTPFSQSGDWNLDLSHYFDAREATFLVERQMSFFNGCWDDSTGKMVPIRETTTTYLDSTGRIVARDFVRSTFDDDPVPTRRCNTTMRPPYSVYPSWDSLASATGLARVLARPAHS